MEKTFLLWICEFFKLHAGINLDNFRTEETRRYDIDSLLFLDWSNVTKDDKEQIKKFASKHNKRFVIHVITSGLVCISEVSENRRT